MLKRLIISGVTGWWLICSAHAATLEGATFPDTYNVDGQSLTLNGLGVRTLTIFRVRIYVPPCI